jgi:DNA-binding CsgD family transcriptional regulator
VFVNHAARRLLAQEDGLRLRQLPTGKSQLAAQSVEAQRALDAALDLCLDPAALEVPHFSRVIEVPRPSAASALVLNVSALPARNEFGSGPEQARAIAFLTNPAEPLGIDEGALRQLYGLTSAECQVVARICQGQPIGAIALSCEVSENTVKSQLGSVFKKTGTHRQVELVRLAISLSSGTVD